MVITLSVVVDFVVEGVDEVVDGFGVDGIKDVFKFWEGIDGSTDLFCTILFWTKTSFGPVNISENDLGVGVDFTMIVFSSFFGFFTSEAEIIMLLFVELISMSAFLTSSSFSLSASKGWNKFKLWQKYIEFNKKSCYVMQTYI